MHVPAVDVCLFVQYPNREPVLRELRPPQSLADLREALEVFDDQHLLIADQPTKSQYSLVESIDQLYDGASLRITVPRRRIFVSLNDHVRDRPVVWYPGAGAEQIESAIVKACGLPIGTPIELVDGDVAVVISATIPNDSSLTAVPLVTDRGHSNGTARHEHAAPIERPSPEGRAAHTPTVPRSASVRNAGSPTGRGSSANATAGGASLQRVRSTTPQTGGLGRDGGYPSRGAGRPRSPARGGGHHAHASDPPSGGSPAEGDPAAPPGRVSAPDEHCVHILAGHTGFVLSLCTVGDVLFTGSQDCNIMIWDLNNMQYIGTLTGHRGFVKCMVATLGKKLLCSGSQDKTIKVWSLETFSSTKTLFGHSSEVNSLSILEGSELLISGGEDRSIRVWDLTSLAQLNAIDQAHLSGIFAVAQLDQGHFISASRDRTMKVWLGSTWQARRTLGPPHYDGVTDVAVGARRGRFYSVSRDRSIRRWDARSYENDLQQVHAHGDWLTSVALSTSESVLFTGGKDPRPVASPWGVAQPLLESRRRQQLPRRTPTELLSQPRCLQNLPSWVHPPPSAVAELPHCCGNSGPAVSCLLGCAPSAMATSRSLRRLCSSPRKPAQTQCETSCGREATAKQLLTGGSGGDEVRVPEASVAAFFGDLFCCIAGSGLSISVSPVDLFHAHAFAFPPSRDGGGEFGLLFHAKEYPKDLQNPKSAASDFTTESPGYVDRNLLYLLSQRRLFVIDPTVPENRVLLLNLDIAQFLAPEQQPERVRTMTAYGFYELSEGVRLACINLLPHDLENPAAGTVLFAKVFV